MSKTHLVIPEGYRVEKDGSTYSEDRYQEVRNRWGGTTLRFLKGCKLKTFKARNGYVYVNLGKSFKSEVHRLVASAFIENPGNKPCVNHKNSNREDNSVENLEWVTYKENSVHAATSGRCVNSYGKQKLVTSEELDKTIVDLYNTHGSFVAISKLSGMNISRSSLGRYVKKRNLPIKLKVNQHDIH